MKRLVNLDDASGQFFKLLDEAEEAGEEIVIARNGTPVAQLVPVRAPKRRLGRWRERVPPLSDEQWAESDQAVAVWFAKSLG